MTKLSDIQTTFIGTTVSPGDGMEAPHASDGIGLPRRETPSVYFDWSGGPVHALHGDDEDVVVYAGLDHLLDGLTEPHRIVGEATFESFNITKREEFVDRCAAEGHALRVINPRITGGKRKKYGIGEKSDVLDVGIIRRVANDGITHLASVTLPDDEKRDQRERVNTRLMELRRTKLRRKSERAKIGWTFPSAKDKWADEMIELLPPADSLTVEQDLALCTGPAGKRRYSKCVVAALRAVAEEANNIKEFDFLTGLYHNGYPSQVRSDLLMHRWGKTLREQDAKPEKDRPARDRVMELTDFRRELRWLFHQIKNVMQADGIEPPHASDGISAPQPASGLA